MKKLLCVLMVLGILWSFALAEGTDSIEIKDGSTVLTLSVTDYWMSEDHTSFTVTVDGFNFLLSGKSGSVADLMPFKLAIGWSSDDYITSESFALNLDPATTAYFSKEDGSPFEEPLYIMIAPKGKSVNRGYFYVIAEGKFHEAKEFDEPVIIVPAVDPKEDPEALRTVGAFVTFGVYPQTEAGDDLTPIEWRVLDYDEENHRSMLISRYGLDKIPFNAKNKVLSWDECSLRDWLNKDFLNAAFTYEEQSAILITEVDNDREQGDNYFDNYSYNKTIDGTNTFDKIFLLSVFEANQYFPDNKDKYCALTDYCIKKATNWSSDYMTEGRATGIWWLRTSDVWFGNGAVVAINGSIDQKINNIQSVAVRPVLWVDLESDCFVK